MTSGPLATASNRLRDAGGRFPGRPGRPRKPRPDPQPSTVLVTPTLAPVLPRLLDVPGSAGYLACSPWTIRDLEAAGVLKRVRIPLPNGGELRRVLFDRQDLDALIRTWKDA